ncbi:outer membrane beta-barrel protein [Oceanobacter mangrovi]|uniref:outer membrane beta-barrel protein n=1 Tax=Oceanobacter mangrovi TaxID=2862510 RepID=UPI001C8D91CE|nr:outer membrane beta-barrel protein [Oceanobacter mangrovi]
MDIKAWQLPLVALAATASAAANAVEPEGIMLGSGVTLLPGVEVSISDNNNIYLEDGDENSAVITRVRPNAALNADLGATQLQAYYELESGSYDSDSDNNYLDQLLTLGADIEATSRMAFGADLTMNKGHDDRGTGSLQTDTTNSIDPSEYTELTLGGDFTYGADSAFANVTAYASTYSKEYDNNKTITEELNYDKTTLGAELGLKVSSATRVLFELRNSEISYSKSAGEYKDGSLLTFLVGASWDITGKTTGEFKVGTAKRSFDTSGMKEKSSFSWEGNVSWSPKSYSTVTLTTSQSSNESTGIGSFIDNNYSAVNWDHEFSTKWALNANASMNNDDYVDGDRTDKTVAFGIKGIYSPNKMVDVTGGLEKSKRDSDAAGADYDKQVLSLGVNLAF